MIILLYDYKTEGKKESKKERKRERKKERKKERNTTLSTGTVPLKVHLCTLFTETNS